MSRPCRPSAYALRYRSWAAVAQAHPLLVKSLNAANHGIVALFYGAFAALLVVQGAADPWALLPLIGIPGAAFVAVSLVRARLNAPRPFEKDGIEPLVAREGSGRSFPSRHAFSAFTIAACWWVASPVVAVVLLVLACLLAVLRVAAGVHYPRDVVAGAVVGLATGALTVAATELLKVMM